MHDKPLVSLNLVVLNGEKYIGHFLSSVTEQSYPHENIEVNIWDNGSTDRTKEIIQFYENRFHDGGFLKYTLHESEQNLGMWPGHEALLDHSQGEYIVAGAVDVILDQLFVEKAILRIMTDNRIGAVQGKIFSWELRNGQPVLHDLIDTCGFEIHRSRKILNIGHGQKDIGQLNQVKDIFAVEGAIPVFRKSTLLDIKVEGEFADKNYFWYGDDLDMAWRINLYGWRQIYDPEVIAWHDRQTTKSTAESFMSYLRRVKTRRQIPIRKRRLDWRNTWFTIIKNDFIINILKDLPRIVGREIAVIGYSLLFEPSVFKEWPVFFKSMPTMLRKRKIIMNHTKVSPQEFQKWLL